MIAFHRALHTWRDKVDLYIALSEFARNKFIDGGIPAGRITVKPNFTGASSITENRSGDFALFVGRLSLEKGAHLLPAAVSLLDTKIPLWVAGDGPMSDQIRAQAKPTDRSFLELLGRCTAEEVSTLMTNARFLLVPSLWYEGFPMVVVEAFSRGLPVIASRLGSLAEIVEDGRTGMLFTPGDSKDLAVKMTWALSNPDALAEMGRAARHEYETKYSAERNYVMLMDIYRRAIASHGKQSTRSRAELECVEN
jgi:glycosyltransferase involved in cell wall biosynthesis